MQERLDLLADNAQDGWRGASYNDTVLAFQWKKHDDATKDHGH